MLIQLCLPLMLSLRFCCNPGDIPKFNGKNTLTSESNKMMVIFNAEYPIFKINNYYTHDVPVHYMKGFKTLLQAGLALVPLNRLLVGCGTTPRRQSGDSPIF